MINLYRSWVELCFFVILVIGFIVSIASPSLAINYFIIIICGMMAGGMLYQGRKAIKLPNTLVVIGFVLGYMLGTRGGSWKVILILFIIGVVVGYYIYEKKYLKV